MVTLKVKEIQYEGLERKGVCFSRCKTITCPRQQTGNWGYLLPVLRPFHFGLTYANMYFTPTSGSHFHGVTVWSLESRKTLLGTYRVPDTFTQRMQTL